jgi:hypothetical protein
VAQVPEDSGKIPDGEAESERREPADHGLSEAMHQQDKDHGEEVVGREDVNPERDAAEDSDPERGGAAIDLVLQEAETESEHQSPERENVGIVPLVSHSPGGEKSGSEDDVESGGDRLRPGRHRAAQKINGSGEAP